MNNKDIALSLEEMATLMELNGENSFRIRSYSNAVRQVELLKESVTDLIAAGTLDSVRGIGKKLADNIAVLIETGKLPGYEELKAELPEGLLEMLDVPGLGAKRVRGIYESLGISDVDALAKACEAGDIEQLSGFGKKTAENILKGVAYLQKHRGRFLSRTAQAEAENLRAFVQDLPGVIRLEVTGSVRRRMETSKDVDIVVSTEDPIALADAFASYEGVEEITGKGETKVSVILTSGMSADLRMVADDAFPYILHHFTGSKEHNTMMRQRAKERGWKLNEYGLFDGDKRIDCDDEVGLFAALDLAYIAPELREGQGEIEAAEAGRLPDLVTKQDLKGTLHVHTTYSDGRNSVEEMAKEALKLGYSYIAICDHSKAAAYANGLNETRVRAQWDEIEKVNDTLDGIRVLKGIEVDILGEGRLDFDDGFLAEFDVVVASIHSKFSMTEKEATERVIRAVENPHVDILGHLTGRLLLSREGYPLDIRAVIDAAAETKTAIEMNANPARLELDWRYLDYAKEKGVKIPINTDAHSTAGLSDMHFGVGMARKGGLEKGDVQNALPLEAFLAELNSQG
ncbi:MAG: DNA polymerase (family 10) [Candidatus Latescibacterota bacterium]|jgi:DNA polymerase (family 10)